jgi:pimeloyl-ACP methyl ester carboxylesterase
MDDSGAVPSLNPGGTGPDTRRALFFSPFFLIVVFLGGLVVVLSPKLAEALLFRPSIGNPGPAPALAGIPGEDVWLDTTDGLRIHAWWYPASRERSGGGRDGGATPAVLLLHGNAGDISHRAPLARGLLKEGLSVLLLEYRGYGGSEGEPSEEGLHLDGLAGLDFLLARGVAPGNVVLFGRSMGGAVAARLAGARPVGSVILESAFTSLHAMAGTVYPFLPGFLLARLRGRFDTVGRMESLSAPVLVVHGTTDEIVPFEMGEKLLEAAGSRAEWYPVSGAGHNDVFQVGGREYFRTLATFIRSNAGDEPRQLGPHHGDASAY